MHRATLQNGYIRCFNGQAIGFLSGATMGPILLFQAIPLIPPIPEITPLKPIPMIPSIPGIPSLS
jgi:hypothetical protein